MTINLKFPSRRAGLLGFYKEEQNVPREKSNWSKFPSRRAGLLGFYD